MKTTRTSTGPNGKAQGQHGEYVIGLAKRLADGTRPGVLATVDEAGKPHVRWMATVSLRDFPLLYTITCPASQKVRHIQNNPHVSWMFSNDEMNLIVNLEGEAHLVCDPVRVQQVWKMLEDKSRAYFLSLSPGTAGFSVIETEITHISCTVPKYDLELQARSAELPVIGS